MKNTGTFLSDLRESSILITVEGERLRLRAPKGVLTPELQAELTERKDEIIHFLQQKAIFEQPIQPISRDGNLPISFAQQRLWFLNRLEGDNATYNLPASLRLDGPLNRIALEQSLREIVQRHEALRTTFPMHQGEPIVRLSEQTFQLNMIDLRALSPEAQEAETRRLVDEEAVYPVKLETGPLFRATLLQLGVDSHVLMLNMHHIISDGWSIGILIREFSALYKTFSQGQPSSLPPLPIQYVDFAHWQRQWLTGEMLEQQADYWKQQLAGAPALLELPTDYPRPAVQSFQGASLSFFLSPELMAQLKHLSQLTDTTLFMVLWSAFAVLLSRYSGQSDIIIGSPIANRTHSQTESLIGFFVNMLVLRLDLSSNPPFEDVLQRAKQVALEAYSHQDIPFEQLIEKLRPERNLSHSPLFQVGFTLLNVTSEHLELSGLTLTPIEPETITAKHDLTLFMKETSQGLRGILEYNTHLFKPATITRTIGHFQTLLEGIVNNPQQPIQELPLLTASEWQHFRNWNETATEYPREQCFHQLFEAQVKKTPNAIAVTFGNQQLSYEGLNQGANQLAHYLQSLGLKPEALVGLCIERSINMVVGLLGIIKAGGAYLPLDPSYPKERLAFMLDDAKVKVLLTQSSLVGELPETTATIVCLDVEAQALSQFATENPTSEAGLKNLAYLIYTSGSTGKPKGVQIAHQGLCNLAQAQIQAFGVQSTSRVLQFASISFDASISEIAMSLCAGAQLCLAHSHEVLPGPSFIQLLQERAITHVTLPPSVLGVLAIEDLPSLQQLIVAGEACPADLAAQWSRGRRFFNAYGPTEGTVCATIFENMAHRARTLPIGWPIANTQTYILSSDLQQLPVGIPGELHIGGVNLARGYLNRPGLTAEKFISHPFSEDPNARLYKTGDLARYLPDGSIEFLGRIDNQVKIRGFRIEPGEIEQHLRQHPEIGEAMVVATDKAEGDRSLTAYFTQHPLVELWPSIAEFYVYDDIVYRSMSTHESRNQGYLTAFKKVLKGKTVVEIGPGPEAILSRLCLEAGAVKVYAIELLEETYHKARQTLKTLGLEERIILIHGDAQNVELPEKMDYCVSEIVGAIGGSEGAGQIINGARRFLHDSSCMLPQRSLTKIAAITLPENSFRYGFSDIAAHYVEKIFAQVGYRFDFRICLKNLPKQNILSNEAFFEDLDYTRNVLLEADHDIRLTFEADGAFNGLLVWLNLCIDSTNVVDILETPESWLPVYFPIFEPGVVVAKGDTIKATISRRLCENGLNPDYFIEGQVIRQAGNNLSFQYNAYHFKQAYKHSSFFEKLFVADDIPVLPKLSSQTLRVYLESRLPHYMVPSAFFQLDAIPLTPNGKVDRRALPQADGARQKLETVYTMPQTEIEQRIAQVWQNVLQLDDVGIDDNFFEVGGHSLLMVRVQSELQALFEQPLSVVELFQHPTIRSLAIFLTHDETQQTQGVLKTSAVSSSKDIAIIGMAGRFPGARDVDAFWTNLRDGFEAITFFSDEELLAAGIDPNVLNNPNYVKANGALEGIELFDPAFFGYSPREAEIMDPQHRLFLECAWEAIEKSGYDVERITGAVGVYAGSGISWYLLNNIYSHPDLVESVGSYRLMILNDKDHLATRTSYKLNLKGPSVSIQTACSTSLVAVHLACQSLMAGECEMALAGGVAIGTRQKTGYVYQQDMIVSPDGHCRAFDAKAQGTVAGNGLGIVVLKLLDRALADGDYIHAVIKGSAINNDGALKVGYTAPTVNGQAAVIAGAMGEMDPETITYVETHGTGTTLGDPIEIAALNQAYQKRTHKKGFCAIGSVKTNVGHLDAAAGVTGLIKTALALEHKLLPPSLHFEQPNPKIDFANSPFFVNTTLSEWKTDGTPRRAGVSSFGIGGTNAHVILEEAPTAAKPSTPKSTRHWQLLLISAQTEPALEAATTRLTHELQQHPELNLADVAYTLSIGRKAFEHRRMLVCPTNIEATEIPRILAPERFAVQTQQALERPVVFMFSGQGSQYVNMGLQLYQQELIFREQIDKCAEILKPLINLDLREVLYPNAAQTALAEEQLKQTAFAQPALFVIEYALAQLFQAWGLHPVAMIGHSIGEYVAACLANVFALEDALALVAIRGQLMQSLPAGAMLSVPLSEETLQPLLNHELSLAAHNTPSQCVVSGTDDAITALEIELKAQHVECMRLHTSHAFHSAMMTPILAEFTAHVANMRLNPPDKPYLSNVSGTWVTAEQAIDPRYWARHLRETVRFAEGVQELLKKPQSVLLELGPGRTLATLARRQANQATQPVILYALRHPSDLQADMPLLLTTLGKLWLAGVSVDLSGFYAGEQRQRLPLPTYPFERQRYWIEPSKDGRAVSSVSLGKKTNITDWFYLPGWKSSPPPTLQGEPAKLASSRYLVFVDACGLGTSLVEQLQSLAQDVIMVSAGSELTRLSDNGYTLNPKKPEDYDGLFQELRAVNKLPQNMVHLWTVTPNDNEASALETIDHVQDLGFYSLLFLAQALGKQNMTDDIQLTVVSNNLQAVTGEETLCPEKATVLGPVKVIGLEYPNIRCRSIDVLMPRSKNDMKKLVEPLLAELTTQTTEQVVAYRGRHRWVPTFEAIKLDHPIDRITQLREDGTYLITGGLGGIGLLLAEYLAKTGPVKLILTGRSLFPSRNEWANWLATHDDDDVSRKIGKLQALEALGAKVWVARADVADLQQMEEVITRAKKQFGQIHGVIHAAGVPGGGVIQRKTPAMAASILAPKVRGAVVLNLLLQDFQLDFFVLCSSLDSILEVFGQIDYCAANAFLDAFAHYLRTQGMQAISINWDGWQEVGMAVDAAMPVELQERRAKQLKRGGILPPEGVEAFSRILRGNPPQALVSTQDFMLRIEQNKASKPDFLESAVEQTSLAKPIHPRPDLNNAYVEPRDHLERTLSAIWIEALGIEQIGIHDNFFELGGDSLLAIGVMARVEQQLGQHLPLATFFESATIEQFANVIRQETDAQPWSSLVAIQSNGSKQPFFCVPGSGGNVMYLYELAHHLGQNNPFYGLQALGLDGESAPHTRVEDIAAHYLKEIQHRQPDGPYLLGGHSFGGAVALEMCQQLQRQGQEVALLVILDIHAPYPIDKPIVNVWDDTRWLVELAGVLEQLLGKDLEVTYDALSPLAPEEQLHALRARLIRANWLPPESDIKPLRGLLEVYKANCQTQYFPQTPLKVPRIALLKASEPPTDLPEENVALLEMLNEPTWGWSKFSDSPVVVHVVPGDHITMMTSPHVQVLAEKLKLCLDQAQERV